jgi:DNA topoisomerase-1
MIVAGIGRFGPYVKHGKVYASLEDGDEVMTVGLNRAVTLIAEKKLKPGRSRFGADPGKPLGDHPDKGGPIVVKKGRYGPYVSHDGVNATLPNDITPETVTLEQAVSLIDARAAMGGGKKKGKAKAAPKKAKADEAEAKPEAATSTARRAAGRKTASGKAAKAAAPKKAAPKPARKKAAD